MRLIKIGIALLILGVLTLNATAKTGTRDNPLHLSYMECKYVLIESNQTVNLTFVCSETGKEDVEAIWIQDVYENGSMIGSLYKFTSKEIHPEGYFKNDTKLYVFQDTNSALLFYVEVDYSSIPAVGDPRVTDLTQRLNNLSSRLNETMSKIVDLNSQMDNLSEENQNLEDEVENLSAKLNETKSQLNYLDNRMDNLKERIDELEEKTENLSTEKENLKEMIHDLKKKASNPLNFFIPFMVGVTVTSLPFLVYVRRKGKRIESEGHEREKEEDQEELPEEFRGIPLEDLWKK